MTSTGRTCRPPCTSGTTTTAPPPARAAARSTHDMTQEARRGAPAEDMEQTGPAKPVHSHFLSGRGPLPPALK
ncbi:hypothetical protein QFZ32_008238 [Streptomyces canus]|nr:hypothetical protein [Streptomyces canus]MDQ1072798.1 hypothetical protein [Streptomyces canus]